MRRVLNIKKQKAYTSNAVNRKAKNSPIVTGNHPLMAVIISAPKISLESKSPDEMGGFPCQEDPYHQ